MESIDRSPADEIARLQRQLEERNVVCESNRRMAEFGIEESRFWKRRAKFYESVAGALRVGYNQMSRLLAARNQKLHVGILQEIHEDYHPGEAPLFLEWEDE